MGEEVRFDYREILSRIDQGCPSRTVGQPRQDLAQIRRDAPGCTSSGACSKLEAGNWWPLEGHSVHMPSYAALFPIL